MKRKSRRALIAAVGSLMAHAATAEPGLAGTYEGSFELETLVITQNARPRLVYYELAIQRVEGGRVAGTWKMSGGPCEGSNPVDGTLEGVRLELKAAQPPRPPCRMPPIRLTVEGDTLRGSYGPREVRLRR